MERCPSALSSIGLVPSLLGLARRASLLRSRHATSTDGRNCRHPSSQHPPPDMSGSLAGAGKRCNGRRLTAIYYLNRGWRVEEHGGALRIMRREQSTYRDVTHAHGATCYNRA